MIKKTFPVVLLVLAVPASAAVSSVGPSAVRTGASSFVVQYASTGTPIAAASRTISAGATGEALIRDMFNVSGPVGNLPVAVSRTVTAAQVASGFSRVMRLAGPVGLALTAVDLLSGIGYRVNNGGEIDLGVTATDRIFTDYWVDVNAGKAPSKSQACTLYGKWLFNTNQAGNATSSTGQSSPYLLNSALVADAYWGDRCQVDKVDPFTGAISQSKFRYVGISQQSTAGKGCVELSSGEVTKARPDGKCPTGRYESAAALSDAVLSEAVKPVVSSDVPAAVKALIDSGGSAESSPISLSGPQSQTSSPSVSTKTGPSGSVVSTTTNNYQYNYAGDTINYTVNQTTVTETTAPDGTKQTQTETSDKTPEKTNCELYPESIGCMKLGEPGETKIPESKKNIDISPEGISLPSGCPSDLALPGGRVVSYASACDAAQKMRPLVIAAGVFSALLIAVAAIRGNG